jgi:DNA-binding NarL/FixJ family response regulator
MERGRRLTPSTAHLKQPRVAVLSDYPIIRLGLRAAAENVAAEVVLEATPSIEAVPRLAALRVDIGLLDIGTTPLTTVRALCAALVEAAAAARVIGVECAEPRPATRLPLVEAGLAGYVCLACGPEVLGAALNAVSRGESVTYVRTGRDDRNPLELLTSVLAAPRLEEVDTQILRLLALGHIDRVIGAQLGMSETTVKRHVALLEQRFHCATRFQLGVWAASVGLVEVNAEPAS